MNINKSFILKNETGAALVIALVMMIVLTLIGLASIFSSTFEMKLSGNKRGATDAFYSADSGIQVIKARTQNFNLDSFDPGTLQYDPFTDAGNPNPTNAQAVITYDTTQEGAPRGHGFSAMHFEFQHFLIASTGTDQIDVVNPVPSTCTIQEKVVRLIPTLQGGY
jgi:hypothetical protein